MPVKIAVLLLVTLFSTAQAAAEAVFVGNHGDGFLRGNQIFLRDLDQSSPIFWGNEICRIAPQTINRSCVENLGTSGALYFGKSIDPEIARLWAAAQTPFEFEKIESLLLRKLTDSDVFYPGFGRILASIASLYRFEFTNELGEHPEAKKFPQEKLVRLALRNDFKIRISKTAWNQLSPEHRAGLVVHELMASLAVKCAKTNSHCGYPPEALQAAVGLLFFEKTLRNLELIVTMTRLFALPQIESVCLGGPTRISPVISKEGTLLVSASELSPLEYCQKFATTPLGGFLLDKSFHLAKIQYNDVISNISQSGLEMHRSIMAYISPSMDAEACRKQIQTVLEKQIKMPSASAVFSFPEKLICEAPQMNVKEFLYNRRSCPEGSGQNLDQHSSFPVLIFRVSDTHI